MNIEEKELNKTEDASSGRLQHLVIPFSCLCLGARFSYTDNSCVFVKISSDTVVEWDIKKIAENWIGQGVYSFGKNIDDNVLVKE